MSIGKIKAISVVDTHRLLIEWDDGKTRPVDFGTIIGTHKALAPLTTVAAFAGVSLAADGWSVEWPCGIDFGTAQLRRWADEQAGDVMPAADFRQWLNAQKLTLGTAATALGLSRRTIAYYLSGEQPVPKTVVLATVGYDRLNVA